MATLRGNRHSINGATKNGISSATGFTRDVRPQENSCRLAVGPDEGKRRNENSPSVETMCQHNEQQMIGGDIRERQRTRIQRCCESYPSRHRETVRKGCPKEKRRCHCSQQQSVRGHHDALIALRSASGASVCWHGNHVADPKRGRNETGKSGWTEDRRHIVDRQCPRRPQILPDLKMILPDDRRGLRQKKKRYDRSNDKNGRGLREPC